MKRRGMKFLPYEYGKVSMLPTPREMTMSTDITPEGLNWLHSLPEPTRAIRITLNEGAQWPKAVRRGKPIHLSFNAGGFYAVIVGKTRFRRKNVAVFDGVMTVSR